MLRTMQSALSVYTPPPLSYLRCLWSLALIVGLQVGTVVAVTFLGLGMLLPVFVVPPGVMAALMVSPIDTLDDWRFHRGVPLLASLIAVTVILAPLSALMLWLSGRRCRTTDIARSRGGTEQFAVRAEQLAPAAS
jgi:hypothetical protein